MKPFVSHLIGADVGKTSDPSSLAIVERQDYPDRDLPLYECRWLAQFYTGTSYVAVESGVTAMMASGKLAHPLLVVDQTGVGAPIVDRFRAADVPMIAVSIGGGESAAHRLPDGTWRVTKKDLVGSVQVLLAERRLLIPPALHYADVLTRQLRDLQLKITRAGNQQFEAAAGAKDDLAIALCLACWAAERSCGALPTNTYSEDARTEISRAPEGVFLS